MGSTVNLGLFSAHSFALIIMAAVLVGLAGLVVVARRRDDPNPLHWADAGLGGVAGGVIGARLFHVLLNSAYFRDHSGEIFRLQAGGLNWHGALFGALLGIWLAAQWRRVPWLPLSDGLALVWPVGLVAGWAACRNSACGYGAEVWTLADYPAWAASEHADVFGVVVPRYNTQWFGIWSGVALLAIMLLVAWRGWLPGYRLWLALGLSGAAMFVIGFFRGDGVASVLPHLAWEQVLDLSVVAVGIVGAAGTVLYGPLRQRRHPR